jgi:class 3 adenylate cyclase
LAPDVSGLGRVTVMPASWHARIFGLLKIGVYAGPALVGNFGGSRFFDYTAYGDVSLTHLHTLKRAREVFLNSAQPSRGG